MEHRAILTLALVSLLAAASYGLDVYHIGNSLTDETYGMHDVARGKGIADITWGRHMTPGCPLWLLWRDREQKTGYIVFDGEIDWGTQDQNLPYVLANYTWDVVVLQVYPKNGDGVDNAGPAAEGFAGMAYDHNPDCQVYILTSHADAADNWAQEMGRVGSIYEPIANRVSAAFPDRKPVLVVPVLQVMNRVQELIAGGTMPALGTIESYYQDDGGHLGPKGLYMAALTTYATLYVSDPDGAVTSGLFYWQYASGYSVPQSLADLAYDIVWDIVSEYPMAGVNTTAVAAPLTVAQPGGATTVPQRALDLLGRAVPWAAAAVRRRVAPGVYLVEGPTTRR